MKKMLVLAAMIMFVMAPLAVMAMSHESGDHMENSGSMQNGMMDHDKMQHEMNHDMDHDKMHHEGMEHGDMDHGKMGHDNMGAHGGMDMIGSEVKEGVKASAMIKDTSAAMAKMGMESTHHLMVSFANEENGAKLEKGTVAIKVINPDETENKPVKMMGMSGAFGADLALKQKGLYHFYIGTKLEDGKKRQYHFHLEVK